MSPFDPISYSLARKALKLISEYLAQPVVEIPESSIEFRHLALEVKEEFLRLALSTLINRALLNAETKDFYVIIADVVTKDYPYGYYGTIAKEVGFRTPIIITERSGQDLVDYQVRIVLDDTWDGWDYLIDGSDIYFLDEQGNPLYFWIEELDKANKYAVIWVKIPSLPANGKTEIFMFFGGKNPYLIYNNPYKVFLVYDDEQRTLYPSSAGSQDYVYWSFDEADKVYAEAKLYVTGMTSNRDWRVGIVTESDLEKYSYSANGCYYWGYWSNNLEAVRRTPTDGVARSGDIFNPNNVTAVYTVIIFGGTVKFLINGEQKWSRTVTVSDLVNPTLEVWTGITTNGTPGLKVTVYYVLVRRYVEPEPLVELQPSHSKEVETVDLQFSEGVDKILVTLDGDAQEAYYSIDGGQTWNSLSLDTEVLLPQTVTQIRLRFSMVTYFRGYALVGW